MNQQSRKSAGFRSLAALAAGLLLLCGMSSGAAPEKPLPKQPRIVNIYNFIRNSDYRLQNSEDILFETTRQQIELIKPTGMPATWALQYDALINPKYQTLLKEQAGKHDEVAAWWEIPRQLAEKAGIKWRGQHDWDSTANVGFSPGYSPRERRKLVDVYMADFKAVFGHFPPTVGSWYIDEVTLDYMKEKYGIVASCNCKDQVGTDGYTLWGGYWNQAYYPSRLNAYMPAQTKAGQIDLPVFRMLGSDPIYQYWQRPGMFTLEPVYSESGASPKWVDWFMKGLIQGPPLAFAYTQAGQENSFGWDGMKKGLTMQIELLDKQSKAGEIQVMTLEQSGRWFKSRFPVTPPTSMVYLEDWKGEGRKTVWYNSRFYRMNLLWEKEGFFIRDLHRFDERVRSETHDSPLATTSLAYGTLPIMDGSQWSSKDEQAGIRPLLIAGDGRSSPLVPDGQPEVRELEKGALSIRQPLVGGGAFFLVCREATVTCTGVDGAGKPLPWGMEMVGGERLKSLVGKVEADKIDFKSGGAGYELKLPSSCGTCEQTAEGHIRMISDKLGKLVMALGDP